MIEAKGIIKRFGNIQALDTVNVTIKKGGITLVLGPSGSGKTTLVKSLSLLDCPDSGSINIDDLIFTFPTNKKNWDFKSIWPKLTVVFQQHFLWPHLTLKENLLLPLQKKKFQDNNKHFNRIIESFNMTGFIDRYPNQVSLGQRQRAALARAVLLNPEYLFLDEITSALDVEQTSILIDLLFELRTSNIGILIVTHLIHFAQVILEKNENNSFIFLDEGKVVESGKIVEFKNPHSVRLNKYLSVL
ncbi:MAG: ATP-binding cassette domain-containing protein [Bacteroidales bacterium]|jgi:ABC-type polar amino acid transport system ATPase subunit|nr:ATP-binding cassette domain-containing protein [Bacteroidales bacterium]